MKTVFITGATSGIGKATAKIFAMQKGYRLILCGRRMDLLEKLKNPREKIRNGLQKASMWG